ncbi:hypothetical protein QVD17_26911 [Tagetes erecta]|uniref:Uncharacterized protein n=1 Tax=Tagetes erecta TaxID=13708 RepID=A0AAD8KBW0_TARER|nr:hypothetical protein QVD17_26911 [Tagetes erecta]
MYPAGSTDWLYNNNFKVSFIYIYEIFLDSIATILFSFKLLYFKSLNWSPYGQIAFEWAGSGVQFKPQGPDRPGLGLKLNKGEDEEDQYVFLVSCNDFSGQPMRCSSLS